MKKAQTFLLSLCSLISIHLNGAVYQWTVEDKDGWNTDEIITTYYHYSELQRQWAWDLLGSLHMAKDATILDFGCGDGKITAEIASCVPKGFVDGYDISASVISFAKRRFPKSVYPNLNFLTCLTDLKGPYDYITAFCVFHVLKEPQVTLLKLKECLKLHGKLLLIIPAGGNAAFYQGAANTFDAFHIPPVWQKNPPIASMKTLNGCHKLLLDCGYNIDRLELIEKDNPFISIEEFHTWMLGTLTANWNIPWDIAPAFFDRLIEEMRILDPNMIDEEGVIHFKLARIHAIATK